MYLKRLALPYIVRQSFPSIRCEIAPLRIETERFENMNVEERICQICNTDIIEDEMHFIM